MLLPFHQKDFTEELAASAVVKLLTAGEQIVGMNKFIQVIPILNSGLLGVYRTDDDGRDMLLYYIKPGESCIMSFLAGVNNDTSKVKVIAEDDSELTLIPIDRVTKWVGKYPEWTDYIFKLYHQRFEELLNVVNSIAFQKMDERIWKLLIKKSELMQSNEITITHQQLADELGSTREVISRLLKQMEKTGIVSLGRNKITLV
jgi:CRP/FNR family transcriptional regulator